MKPVRSSFAGHEARFQGLLRFGSAVEAEACLLRLLELRRRFLKAGDRPGAARADYEARRGLQRLRMISRNRRVGEEKRREKAELALWFETWLLDPEAFPLWLEMRKRALERMPACAPS